MQAARSAQKLFGQVIDLLDGTGWLPAFLGLPAADRNRLLLTEPLGTTDAGTGPVVNNSTTITNAGPLQTDTLRFSEAERKTQLLEASIAKVKLRIVTSAFVTIGTVVVTIQKRNITTGVLTSLGTTAISLVPLIPISTNAEFVVSVDLSAATRANRFIGPGEVLEMTLDLTSDPVGGGPFTYQLFHSRGTDELHLILVQGS